MNKKALSETDIRTRFITPALTGSSGEKWDLMTQIREEAYFTKARVIVRGKTVKRGEAQKADYLLYYRPNLSLAVIEAKDNNHSLGAGLQQALEYAKMLDVPFAYSSNGDGFIEHDRTVSAKMIRFRLVAGIDPDFAAISMNAGALSTVIEGLKSGMAASQVNISQPKLRSVPIPIRPLTQQRRIIAKVKQLMALVDTLGQQLAASRATAEKLLSAIVAELTVSPPSPLTAG